MILLTLAHPDFDGDPVAVNPYHVHLVSLPDPDDKGTVGCRVYGEGTAFDILLVRESFDSVRNQLANAMQFHIVASRSRDG